MQYVIGIDGGGTKTLLNIAATDKTVIASSVSGSTNLASEDIVTIRKRLLQLIASTIQNAGFSAEDCAYLCMGAAGVISENAKNIITDILSEFVRRDKILVTDDAVTAFEGSLGQDSGIALISGTGSICHAKDPHGNECTVGGWGHFCGDEGSGYSIGRAVLAKVFHSIDGRAPSTGLTALLFEHLKISSSHELVDYLYGKTAPSKETVSSLAVLCSLACSHGDMVAEEILKDAAHQLYLHIEAAVNRLSFPHNRTLLAYSGSILKKDTHLREHFKMLVAQRYPLISIIESKNDAAYGAVSLAVKQYEKSLG